MVLVPELPAPGGRLALPEAESHYLTRVCRAREGDRVTATDGRGAVALLRLIARGHPVMVEVESCDRIAPARQAWVLAGSPEGERGDWLVEKLAELGVAVFQPLDCERGGWDRLRGRAERWQRLAVAALRQSRRRFLLEIRAPLSLDQALAGLPAGGGCWVGDQAGLPASRQNPPGQGVAVGLVGPSAGLTPAELGLVSERGFAPICLSDGRLRAETAAMAWACWWAGMGGGSTPGG